MSTPTESPLDEPPAPRPAKTYAAAAGLTGPGVYVILFAVSLVGLLIDVFTGGGLGPIFGVVFVAACGYTALSVRPSDRLAALTAPPLVFAALMLLDNLFQGDGDALTRLVNTANALLSHGPTLWIGTGLALVIVLARYWTAKRATS